MQPRRKRLRIACYCKYAGGGWRGTFSLLAKVDLLVPLSPDLGGCEHTTRSAHVTESSLSSTVSSSSRDTRNTGNGTTWIDVELAIVIDLNASLPVPDLPTINMPSFSSIIVPISVPKVKQRCVLTGTPGLSRGLVTSLLAHCIRLTLVLGHSGVDSLDDIGSDGRKEDLYNSNQRAAPKVQFLPYL